MGPSVQCVRALAGLDLHELVRQFDALHFGKPCNGDTLRLDVYDSPAGKERLRGLSLYLLRNADNRAKGLGFALAGNFYPDFLLWLVDDNTGKQWLSFIDPKGIRNLNISDPQFGLYREIKQIETQIDDRLISLSSLIVSVTAFNDLLNVMGTTTKSDLEDRNVLFMSDGRLVYLGKLLTQLLA